MARTKNRGNDDSNSIIISVKYWIDTIGNTRTILSVKKPIVMMDLQAQTATARASKS